MFVKDEWHEIKKKESKESETENENDVITWLMSAIQWTGVEMYFCFATQSVQTRRMLIADGMNAAAGGFEHICCNFKIVSLEFGGTDAIIVLFTAY